MSETDLPMMPLFVKDWLAATVHWTDAERGAYMSLLVFQWANKMIPTDEAQLARIMGTSEKDFDDRWAAVGQKFDGDNDGLFNNRLEVHRKNAIRLRDAKVRGADAANVVRRAKKTLRVESANAERNASATPTSTSESISKNEEEDKNIETDSRSANAERGSRGTFVNYWNEEKWIDFKLRMPNRAGGNDDVGAKKAWRGRLREGHTWEQLFAGADKYNAYCEAAGKVGTEYVMTRKTFCGPGKRFLEDWELPADAARAAPWSPPDDDPPEAA